MGREVEVQVEREREREREREGSNLRLGLVLGHGAVALDVRHPVPAHGVGFRMPQ